MSASGNNYLWSPATSLSSTTASNPTASPSSTTTYTVTVSDGNGCQDSDQVTVTVNSLPNVDGGADQTVCNGDNVTCDQRASSYTWDKGVTDNVTFTATSTTTYTVIGTDANGCQDIDQLR